MKQRSRVPPATDYSVYVFNRRELAVQMILQMLFTGMTAYLFYDSALAWLLLMLLSVFALKKKRAALCRQRKRRLESEFREVILSVSSNLQAGYSVENAFREAVGDIALLYGRTSLMAGELRLLIRRLDNNEQLEDILMNLAARSGVRDIGDFADVFQIAKRSGGELRTVIANTAQIISGKQEVRREIQTVMSEKKLELTIMRYIPFFIIFYISITSKGYFESLYHNLFGWMAMTVALGIYAAACRMSDKITDIEV
ncbi:MAG: type II secretion system F family protein [Roseburia sp.]|nr:type II secretion system F family protein [Roseburia sp.]